MDDSVIAAFHDAADAAVKRLSAGGFDMKNLSAVGKGFAVLLPLLVVLAAAALAARAARAAEPILTFGPGKVSCQPLTGTQMDCLLASSRITDERNVASFGVDSLPPGDQALFRKWCLSGSDACSVTLTGRRESVQSTRLSAVTSVHWTRPSAPENEEVARTADPTPAFVPDTAAAPH